MAEQERPDSRRRDERPPRPSSSAPRHGTGARRKPPVRSGARPSSGSAARPPRPLGPRVDDDVTGQEIDRSVARQLSALSEAAAARVARHLVMAARLLDTDPAGALEHARAARAVPGATRLPSVREAVGLTAYAAGEYAEALIELKAARRISGSADLIPVIADCERGVRRPDRALRMLSEPDVDRLDPADRAELLIVAAGAHRDLGRLDAALVTLKVPALSSRAREPWVARLQYAYADALLDSGDAEAAREWFERAAEADVDGDTDAGDRLAALEGYTFIETAEDGPAGDDDPTG